MYEKWKDIKGFEGIYQVSNLGNVRSLDREILHYPKNYFQKGRFLKPALARNNYLMVVLVNHNNRNTRYIHRLVAEHFIDNPNGFNEVNHKDENKQNNRFDNLEWCDHKYNMNYGNRNKKISLSRKGGVE